MPTQSRREFLKTLGTAVVSTALAGYPMLSEAKEAGRKMRRPNILMILTDDQGYGDVGIHGNDRIHTPNIDGIARSGVDMTNFSMMPVCSPTRACLLTGRYNYRTGVTDTWLGRSMMRPDETTLAEALKSGGYRTGIFGKWHLGDCYPMRSIDNGFDESLVCRGGGLAQPSGPPNNGYFDPILDHNGVPEKRRGYCTEIFTDAAFGFIDRHKDQPFFVYLAVNVPHVPLEVDEKYVKPYLDAGLDETTARTYAMITNLDENIGRLLNRLSEHGLSEDTIVIFMGDNGPQYPRFNCGLRDVKGSVYEGGIRVPCFIKWPKRIRPGSEVDRMAGHVDMFPTLLEACRVKTPGSLPIDGVSLMPILAGDVSDLPERYMFFQWHRGDAPELYNNCAVKSQRYKLVNGKELYDLEKDLGEQTDVAAYHPVTVSRMRRAYEDWYHSVSSRGYDPPLILLGTAHENPTILTRQDWRGPNAEWSPEGIGHWEVKVTNHGPYEVKLEFDPVPSASEVHLKLGSVEMSAPIAQGTVSHTFDGIKPATGPTRLEAWVEHGDKKVGMSYVYVRG